MMSTEMNRTCGMPITYLAKERISIHWLCFGSLHGKCNRVGVSSLSIYSALHMRKSTSRCFWHAAVFLKRFCLLHFILAKSICPANIIFNWCEPASPETRLCDWYVGLCRATVYWTCCYRWCCRCLCDTDVVPVGPSVSCWGRSLL